MVEDFLEDFEYHAHACNLTDTQRVKVIVHYIDPSTREFCKTLNGFHSCDWTLFQQSLIKAFRSSIPPHLIRDATVRSGFGSGPEPHRTAP